MPLRHPLDDPPPGMTQTVPPMPTAKFWQMASKVPPRIQQPAYYCHPVGDQLWHVFNAHELPLGRMTSRIAQILQGKHRPTYSRSLLTPEESGDFVIVVNGRNPMLSGPHAKKKIYRHHTGRPGGLKEYLITDVIDSSHWDRVVKQSVSKMLPKNAIREDWMKRLHVFEKVYHNFKDIPQFLLREGRDDNMIIGLDGIIADPDAYIKYGSSYDNLPDKIKHLPIKEDLSITKSLKERGLREVKLTRAQEKEMRFHAKIMRRMRVFNFETKRWEH